MLAQFLFRMWSTLCNCNKPHWIYFPMSGKGLICFSIWWTVTSRMAFQNGKFQKCMPALPPVYSYLGHFFCWTFSFLTTHLLSPSEPIIWFAAHTCPTLKLHFYSIFPRSSSLTKTSHSNERDNYYAPVGVINTSGAAHLHVSDTFILERLIVVK